MNYKTYFLSFILSFSSIVFSQNTVLYDDLSDYGRFGFLVGPALYQKAEVNHLFGEYSIEPKMALSYNAGFDYDFHPDKLWSFQVGLFVGHEPANYSDITIPGNEVSGYTEESIFQNRNKASYSLSIPMTLRIQKRLGSKIYGQLRGGIRVMNFKTGSTSTAISYLNGENNENDLPVFFMAATTPETNYYGGFLLGGGISWASKWFLLRSNVMYMVNPQPILKGQYIFFNMVSEDSGGEYSLSGNYFALWLSFHIKRSRDK